MICNRVAILDKGEMKYCGPVADIGAYVDRNETKMEPQKTFLFQVLGDPQILHKSFGDFDFRVISNEQGVASVEVAVPDQAEIDRLVDQLRGNGVSIFGILEQRVSLEDAFLQLID